MKTTSLTKIILILFSILVLAPTSRADEKPLKDFQLSFIPFVGTEGASVADYRYRVSINIFAGVTGGIHGIEAGGFLNITNGPVQGIQAAGFGNLVSGNFQGVQAAGFANIAAGNRQGSAASGFVNITAGSHLGFAGAGFANVSGGNHTGFAGSGFANITGGDYMGFAGAGFANVTGGHFTGFAGAGFANIAGGYSQGLSAAGFANISGSGYSGFAAAGFANISGGHIEGVQLAGFLNVTKSLQGVQIGFINVSDTITDGLAIGFLSFVRRGGLRQIEIAASEVTPFSASFKTGLPGFYNIFSLNLRPWGDESYYSLGYGIGTNITIDQSFALQLEAHSMAFHKLWVWNAPQNKEKLDMLNEGRMMLSYNSGKHVALFGGLVIYNQIFKEDLATGNTGRDIAPSYVFSERQWGKYQSRWWPGIRAGVRFNISG